jgi:hypothetical protein
MQHLPALNAETTKSIGMCAFISRIVAPWILCLLMATGSKGAGIENGSGIENLRRIRLKRKWMRVRRSTEKKRFGAKQGRHLR